VIESKVQELAFCMIDKDATLAVAESCTGGMLGYKLTAIPESSKWFLGGIISYANRIKTDFLSVPDEVLEAKGAVSREVAEIMASSVRSRFGADYGLAITGVAGPGGGTAEKPVGLVYIACADESGCSVVKYNFDGDRDTVRRRAVSSAVSLLTDSLTGQAPPIRFRVLD
jgi:PncC family amidohydrolase